MPVGRLHVGNMFCCHHPVTTAAVTLRIQQAAPRLTANFAPQALLESLR